MLAILGAFWSGSNFEFVNSSGKIVGFAPESTLRRNTAPCLVDRDQLIARLAANGKEIVWTAIGGRTCFDGRRHVTGTEAEYSAVYYLEGGKLKGGITKTVIQDLTK
jgi:hypothetical protein